MKRNSSLEIFIYIGVLVLSLVPYIALIIFQINGASITRLIACLIWTYLSTLLLFVSLSLTFVTCLTLSSMKKLASRDGKTLFGAFKNESNNLIFPLLLLLISYGSYIVIGFYEI